MNERILFLSRMEFAVLLIAGGLAWIECFPLPDAKQTEERQIIEAVYGLVADGLLETDGKRISLGPDMQEVIRLIERSGMRIWIEPGNSSLPQKICYLAEKIIVLENIQKDGKAFRLFVLEKKRFWKWLEDSLAIPKLFAEERKETAQVLELNPAAAAEQASLYGNGYADAFGEIGEWMRRVKELTGEEVYAGLRFVEGNNSVLAKDVLIAQGSMNIWLLWCRPEADIFSDKTNRIYVEPDSVELRELLIEGDWRNAE